MRYMTLAWWSGEVDRCLADAYLPYYQSIRDRLPPEVRRMQEDISLHDAKLRRLDIDIGAGTIVIEFDGYDWQPDKFPDAERRITLVYNSVTALTSTADPACGLLGPHGYGDLGYDELELLADDVIEHRMLFSTGIELHIRFRQLEINLGRPEIIVFEGDER